MHKEFSHIYQDINWVIGPNAVRNISHLSANYYKNIIATYNKKYKLDYKLFWPWINLGLLKNEKINFNPKSFKYFMSENDLRHLSQHITNNCGYIKIGPDIKNSNLSIDFTFFNRGIDPYSIFLDSIHTLEDNIPWYKSLYAATNKLFIPIAINKDPNIFVAFSIQTFKGGIFINIPDRDRTSPIRQTLNMAIDIFHEIGHQTLCIYLLSDKIITSNPDILVYSGARKVLRNSYKALHSAVALTYMLCATHSFIHCNAFNNQEYAYLIKKNKELHYALLENLLDLKKKCKFSNFGKTYLDELFYLCKEYRHE